MTEGVITAAALQFPVTMEPAVNVAAITSLVDVLAPDTLVVTPEGALSGYQPKPGFVSEIDVSSVDKAIAAIALLAEQKRVHIVAGACLCDGGRWSNSALYFGPQGERARYDKINLAMSERGTFEAGNSLPVFDIRVSSESVRLGIQMCREIRYPEQWRGLAVQGAHVIAYVNNAVGSARGDAVWRAYMVSRAAETQRFVVGANNAATDQACPTMIVAPDGEIIGETATGAVGAAVASLHLAHVSDWVLNQAREDIAAAVLKGL